MREIGLFRGQRVDNKEWVEGFYCKSIHCVKGKSELHDYIQVEHSPYELTAHEVIPETVNQYTELTDKNDVKIFKNDFVKFGQNIYQIIFECGGFVLYDKNFDMISKIGGISDNCYSLFNLYLECCWEENRAYDIEVVGNIYDNPELMEV